MSGVVRRCGLKGNRNWRKDQEPQKLKESNGPKVLRSNLKARCEERKIKSGERGAITTSV